MDIKKLESIIVGQRIREVKNAWGIAELILENGTTLKLYESHSDCCASAWGEWVIEPANLHAAITRVEISEPVENFNGDSSTWTADISIFHNQNRLALGECSATDGNSGYYYSILNLKVEVGDVVLLDEEVVDA